MRRIDLLKTVSRRQAAKKLRKPRNFRPRVVDLELRVMPVIGAAVAAPIVPAGTNLDGVVMLLNSAGLGSGEELADQTQVLTVEHAVPNPGRATTITWNLERSTNPVNITVPIPVNAGGAMANNFYYPPGVVPGVVPADPIDIALVNLRDMLPLAPMPAGNNLRLVAPFSPYENGYPIMAPPANLSTAVPATAQLVNIVGYGRQGFVGNGTQNTRTQPVGTKTFGPNQIERFQAGTNMAIEQLDFDGGGINTFGTVGLGTNNMVGGNPAPWLNESMVANGDSGGPELVGTVGNGGNLMQGQGAGNLLQILGVTVSGTASVYGSVGNAVNASAFDQPAGAAPAGFIYQAENAAYGVILDMRDQVLGNTTNVPGATIQDPLTITAYRGMPDGTAQANGPNLIIRVTDTAPGVAANFQYNGIYFNQPINNAVGAAAITQGLTLVGNNGNDTFQIMGNLGVGPITIQGGATNNTLVYQEGGQRSYYLHSHRCPRGRGHSSHHHAHGHSQRRRAPAHHR